MEKISDKVYMLDNKSKSYVRLTKEMYSNILNGNMRF